MRFYLGLGAPKAGTSWLYEYLRQSPRFDFGIMKEYHIWSAVDVEKYRRLLVKREELASRGPQGQPVADPISFLRYQMQQREGAYEQYFRHRIKGEVDSTGDLSPSYSDLTARSLARVRSRLERAGFEVRVIFLMRDPFERLWSGVRMHKRQGRLSGSDEELLRARIQSERPSSYMRTIAGIDEVFSADEVFFGIYEELLTPSGVERVSRFCGVPPDVTFLDTKVNVGPKAEALSAQLESEIVKHYAHVYEFCNDRFPQTRHLWRAPG